MRTGSPRADEIVLAAPYWDFSFPAALKLYIESVTIRGLTFQYTPEGRPVGLCRAKRLVYVTTAGGPIVDQSFGFGYIESLSRLFYGIPSVLCYQAENLDIVGADVDGILSATLLKIKDDPALAETAL